MGFEIGNFKEVVLKELESLGYDLPTGATGSPDGSDKDAFVLSKKYYQKLKTSTMDGLVVLQKDDAIRLFEDMYYWQSKEEETEDNNAYLTTWFSPNFELWDFKGRKLEKNASNYIIDFQSLLYTFGKPDSKLQPSALLPYMGITSLNSYSFGRKCFTSQTEFQGGLTTVATFKEQFRTRFGFTAQRENIPSYLDYNGEVRYGELDKLKYITGKYVVNRGTNDSSTGSSRGIYLGQGEEENVDNMYIGKNPPRSLDLYKEYNFYIKFTEDWGSGYSFYVPATPWLWFENNDCMVKYNQASAGESYTWTNWPQRTMIGYQPFSGRFQDLMDEKLTQVDYIAFSNTINIYSYWPSGEYWGPIYALDEEDILNYIYILEGIRYADTSENAANASYDDLSSGKKPSDSDEEQETGSTSGPSGDIEEGKDTNITPAQPGIKKQFKLQQELFPPGFYGGVYIPTWRYVKEIRTEEEMEIAVEEMNEIIASLTRNGKGDAIVESFITYSGFVNDSYIEGDQVYVNKYKLPAIELPLKRPEFLGGYDARGAYKPVNNKLFTYPYTSFEINGYGEINELKLENWSSEKPTICMTSKFMPGAGILVFPKNYAGVVYNFDASVTSQPLPLMPYTKDDYKNEYNACVNSRTAAITSLSENSIMNGMYSVINAGLGAAGASYPASKRKVNLERGAEPFYTYNYTGISNSAMAKNVSRGATGLSGALMSYHQGMREFEAQLKDVENRPLSVANQNAAPSVPALMGDYAAPFIVWKCARVEFLKKIDEFFTRYGYKVSRFGEVKLKTRPVFNFIKLNEARVKANSPSGMGQEDVMLVKAILEKGITFWHQPDQIGNYGVNNPAPITNNPNYLKVTDKQ